MRLFLKPALLAAFVAAGSPALALDCKTAANQADLDACAGGDFAAADAELNKVYDQVVARLAHAAAPDARTLLVSAQRAWLSLRDAECAFRTSDSEGGSVHPMNVLGCRTELTRRRTADLHRYVSCKADDGDCPTAPAD